MKMKELLLKSIDKNAIDATKTESNTLAVEIQQKKDELSNLRLKQKQTKQLRAQRSFFVEKISEGVPVSVHKKGSEVKVFPEEDITLFFKNPDSLDTDVVELESFEKKVKEQALRLSENDFILDCELVREKRDLFLYVVDMPFFCENISSIPLYKRKRIISKLSFTDNIKEVPFVIIEGSEELEKGLDLFRKYDGCIGVSVKRFGSSYNNNDFVAYLFSKGESK